MKRGIIPKNHENYELCKKCGGECCRHFPCALFPEDLKVKKITEEIIRKKLEDGFCVDTSVQGLFGRVYYFIHPRCVTEWDTRCYFLSDNGCELSEEDRPSGGRALIPNINPCMCRPVKGYSSKDAARAWNPYRRILEKLYQEAMRERMPCDMAVNE